ncbi:MAG: hypothetical protein EZS28_035774, partial [Streblomastix strix]
QKSVVDEYALSEDTAVSIGRNERRVDMEPFLNHDPGRTLVFLPKVEIIFLIN